jgi:phosphate transport system protein
MREAYHDRLGELANHLADMCALVAVAMERATTALLNTDLPLAEQVITDDTAIDTARTEYEEEAYALLALQAPVATDLRTVLAVIHAAESIERMGDLALHVAKAARRRHPAPVLPDEVQHYFEQMGQIAVALAHKTEQVIRTQDVELAKQVENDDDEMDHLHRELFTVLMDKSWAHTVAQAVDVTLLSRFYERFADHAVSVAKRTVFVVTGRMPGSDQFDI